MSSSANARVASIDVMRGLVMMIMMIDHVRETFFLRWQVSDPMDVADIFAPWTGPRAP